MHLFLRIAVGAALTVLTGCSFILNFDECATDADCDQGMCVENACTTAACSTHDDCATGSCIRSTCVDLSETACSIPFDDGLNDVPVAHVGMLMPLTGRNGDKGDATSKGAAVAFNQLNLTATGINGTRVSAVLCDTENNAAQASEHALSE